MTTKMSAHTKTGSQPVPSFLGLPFAEQPRRLQPHELCEFPRFEIEGKVSVVTVFTSPIVLSIWLGRSFSPKLHEWPVGIQPLSHRLGRVLPTVGLSLFELIRLESNIHTPFAGECHIDRVRGSVLDEGVVRIGKHELQHWLDVERDVSGRHS